MQHDFLTVGDVGLDAYRGEEAPRPGGCALNVAVHLRAERAGRVGLLAPLGEDGLHLRELVAARGIDPSLLRVLPGRTPSQEIEVLPDGERRFHAYLPGVLAGWLPGPELLPAILAAGLVYVPVWAVTLPLLGRVWAVRTRGALAVDLMNLSDVPLELAEQAIARCSVVFCGLQRRAHARTIERLLLAAGRPGAATVVITLGPDGALARAGDEAAQVEAAPVPGGRVVDTTGCGDAFAAAFLAARQRGSGLLDALGAGTRRAADVAAHLGAFTVHSG